MSHHGIFLIDRFLVICHTVNNMSYYTEEISAEPEEPKPVAKPLPEVSVVDLYALRLRKFQQRQTTIASMSCAIVENPEENVSFHTNQ